MNGVYMCKPLEFSEELVSKGVFVSVKSDEKGVVEFANSINGTNTATTIENEKINVKNSIMSTSTMTKTIKVFAVLLITIVLVNFIFLILKERKI